VTRFILRRLGLMIIVFAGLVIVAFLLTHVLPGDPGGPRPRPRSRRSGPASA
jgi:ABC-type dipeptide/oligopeptide/nickel transport system permease component